MAKKRYHIPIDKLQAFVTQHKSLLHSTYKNPQKLEYAKRFGKAYYTIAIEQFMEFSKMHHDLSHALKVINYFESEAFINEILHLSGLEIQNRQMFYLLSYHLYHRDNELFDELLHQSLIHYHTAQTKTIDHKELAHDLAKVKKIAFKESFGEAEGKAYFRILVDGRVIVGREGKSIRKLRKQVYREFCDWLDEV
jgi:hypothetical protein